MGTKNNTFVSVTNGADNTYYYPFAITKGSSGHQFVISGGSGSVTITLEATMDGDSDDASTNWTDVTFTNFGVANITTSSILTDTANRLPCYSLCRWKVVASTGGANDGDWTIYMYQGGK
jgi:hypothetical protein